MSDRAVPKPQTPDPRPQTLHPRPQTPDLVLEASDSFRELGLYQCDDMFLGLATTQASLGDVKIGRWNPAGEIESASNEFELVATTYNSEKHAVVDGEFS